MPYKGDTLCLLPQEKEICVKIDTSFTIMQNDSFEVDYSGLYISRRYLKKGWRMFINRPLGKVYILTGTSKIITENLCGNVVISVKRENSTAYGEFYLNLPYLCTSILTDDDSELPPLNVSFKPSKIFRAKENCVYVTGVVKVNKN